MSNFKNEELKQLNLYFTNDEINILKDEIHILKESIHTLTESIDALKEIILTINVRTFDIIN
jgi:prefoldin subunit 5